MSEIMENNTKRKKKRYKILFRLLVGLMIIAAGIFVANRYISREEGGDMVVLDQPSYPVMQISSEKGDYNLMPAYENEIDISLVRNQVSLVNAKSELGIKLYCYDYDITAVQYVLFDTTPDEPIEQGTLNKLDRDEENICTGTIKLEKNLEKEKNYFLQMTIRLDENTQTYYYTQLLNGSEYHLANYLTFAKRFHNDVFSSKNMEKYAIYLEPSVASTNKSLASVNIESTMSSIFYGSLEVTPQTEPQIKIKEINKTYAVLEVSSFVSSADKKNAVQYYNVTETFKLRYTEERMYLLDYRREMGAMYNGNLIDDQKNDLGVGIQDENRIHYKHADDGSKLCFVDEGQLWYYDYEKSKTYKVYSIYSENLSDAHNIAGGSDIRILDLDKKGNITYLIFGYMGRGSYEGKNGIAIMKYNVHDNYSKEVIFMETSVPFDTMRRGLDKCVYVNGNNKFYCLLDGDLHRVDLEEGTDDLIATEIMNESLTVTEDDSLIALENDQDKTKNKIITIMDLETGEQTKVSCKGNERIRSYGFVNDDLVYGLADKEDVNYKNSDELLFPAKELCIVDHEGNRIKTISEEKKYIINASIEGTVIEMQTASKKAGSFEANKSKKHIRYKQDPREQVVEIAYQYSPVYWTQLYFSFPDKIYVKVKPKLVETTIQAGRNNMVVELKRGENKLERYFAYAQGQMVGEYSTLTEAIKKADQTRGNVIDNEETTLWQCAFMDYGKVPGMEDYIEQASNNKKSFKACMKMLARVAGKDPDKVVVNTKKYPIPELIEMSTGKKGMNLSGCSLDEVLYYVDQGCPILTKLTDTKYVIVMSYNKDKIRYLDPVTRESTVVDRSGITRQLKGRGNYFYTYQR